MKPDIFDEQTTHENIAARQRDDQWLRPRSVALPSPLRLCAQCRELKPHVYFVCRECGAEMVAKREQRDDPDEPV